MPGIAVFCKSTWRADDPFTSSINMPSKYTLLFYISHNRRLLPADYRGPLLAQVSPFGITASIVPTLLFSLSLNRRRFQQTIVNHFWRRQRRPSLHHLPFLCTCTHLLSYLTAFGSPFKLDLVSTLSSSPVTSHRSHHCLNSISVVCLPLRYYKSRKRSVHHGQLA